jgi:GTP-binding protein
VLLPLRDFRNLKFIDQAKIRVISGKGGNGCLSFRREPYVPKGGPDGGDGGKGGDVFIEADDSLNTLLDCRYQQQYKAKKGTHGSGNNRHGRNGLDLTIKVPVGTEIFDEATETLMADLDRSGARILVANGGRGGRGNSRFATSRNRAPRRFEGGQEGQDRWLILELKLIADVGLVGLPNSGKSTLISSVSNARPKIADYPFTTKVPALGLVKTSDGTDFVMADIPGLIEGAHTGAGMGDQFLRHIERTKILLHLIDPAPHLTPSAEERFDVIMNELASYSGDLIQRPMLGVITKMDLPENRVAASELRSLIEKKGLAVYEISAVTGEGLTELLRRVSRFLKQSSKND